MSRYLARLVKLEAAIPLPAPAQPEARPQIDLHEIIEAAKAGVAFLETATPLQRIVFHRDQIERLENRQSEAVGQTNNPLVDTLRKVHRVWLPSFLDDARQDLRQAEIDLLREAGFASLDQPGAREFLDNTLFEV